MVLVPFEIFLEPLPVTADSMLFTLAQARAMKPLDNSLKYSDQAIIDAGIAARDALEHACQVFFKPREFTETLPGSGSYSVPLSLPRITEIYGASIDGMASEASFAYGLLYSGSIWPRNKVITVQGFAGYEVCPPRVARASLLLAASYLVPSQMSDRMTSFTNSEGVTERFMTAGIKGTVFGIPECEAVVSDYGISEGLCIA